MKPQFLIYILAKLNSFSEVSFVNGTIGTSSYRLRACPKIPQDNRQDNNEQSGFYGNLSISKIGDIASEIEGSIVTGKPDARST